MQSADLKRYLMNDNTRVVFAKRDPRAWSVVFQAVPIVGFFILVRPLVVPFACFLCVGLLLAGFSPALRVLAVEQAALVLIEKAWFRAARITSIPFTNIVKVVQGNEIHSARVHVVLRDGSAHDISFRAGVRRPKPRFAIAVNRTTYPFPEDPCSFAKQSATALVGYLAAHGLPTERQPLSRFERWNWRR